MVKILDAIDLAAGLVPESQVCKDRAFRPEFVAGAEACRHAVLTPEAALDLSHELRTAVAHRIAKTSGNALLLESYAIPEDSDLAALATGIPNANMALETLGAHVDMIASEPVKASEDHLKALQAVGYSVPQIIALSELCAYVCFQIRLVHGLSLLEATS